MGRMSLEVMHHPLDLAWQDVFTWVSWALAVAMLIIAFDLGRRHRTSHADRAVRRARAGHAT